MVALTEVDIQGPAAAAMDWLSSYADDNSLVLWAYLTGDVPKTPPTPYAVLYPGLRTDATDRRHADIKVSSAYRFTTQYVGPTWAQAAWVQEKIYAAFNGHILEVEGMTCSKMHHQAGIDISREPSMEDLYVGVDTWTFTSTPVAT